MSAEERRQVDSLRKAIRLLQPRISKARNENTRKSLVADLIVHLLTARNLWEQLRGRATEKAVGHVQVVAATSDRMLSMGQTLIELLRAQKRETSLATAACAVLVTDADHEQDWCRNCCHQEAVIGTLCTAWRSTCLLLPPSFCLPL